MNTSAPSKLGSGVHLSVVTPVYKAEGCVGELCRRLKAALEQITEDFEIIMVEDASPDGSWDKVREEAEADSRCRGIKLSRNFGQHFAITAGLDVARGDWVVVMDCDLQDPPEEIAKLYQAALAGNFDIVFGRRVIRKDRWLKQMSSKCFYTVYNYLTDSKFDNSVANFSVSRRKVVEAFRQMREHNRMFPLFVRWLGFNVGYVDIDHASRFEGKTSYSFAKLLRLSLDSIVSQSNKPLSLAIGLGSTLSGVSFLIMTYYVLRYFFLGIPVAGWTTLVVSIWFLGGVVLATLGVLGLYIGKIFNEVKNRPLYIVTETCGLSEGSRGRHES